MAFSIDSGIDSIINESADDGDDGDDDNEINYPVESKINDDLEFTESDIWTFEEEHERRKISQSVNDGTALHNFDSIFPSNFEIHNIPEPNCFFGQILSMFKKVPLDQMIIAKRLSKMEENSLIGLSFKDDTAIMAVYLDHPLIKKIAELATNLVEIEFKWMTIQEIQNFYDLF